MKKILLYAIFTALCFVCSTNSALALRRQIYFKETTFDLFGYPNGIEDEEYTSVITKRADEQFPNARTHMVKSYISDDKPRRIIEYYTKLSGQRFLKEGDHFIFVFSQINNQPATRIEIYPVRISRIHQEFWPTRIDLYVIRYPIVGDIPDELDRTMDDLKKRIGRFLYEGELREDIAILDMEENGPEAEVYVLSTEDDFERVYRFFRRRFRSFPVRPARDGDMLTRDFEIDITRYIGQGGDNKDVFVIVEENPVVVDRTGNSQLYRGRVFIRYVFWEKDDNTIN
jgi:hypothetical protein